VGLGFTALPGLFTIVSSAWHIKPYGIAMAEFSRRPAAVAPANFAEGWSLPWEYLWHAEHGLLLVWVIGVGTVFWLSLKRWRPAYTRGLFWLGAVAGMYLLIVLFSNGFARLSPLGRQARQMVPFLCLTTACGVAYFAENWWPHRRVWLIGTLAFVLPAVLNFAQPLMLQFPNDIVHRVMVTYGHVTQGTTVKGPQENHSGQDVSSRYVLLNARHLFPVQGIKAPPDGKVLFSVPHPLQFLPYQYEGFSLMELLILRSTDISIRLIDTQVVP